MTYDAWVLEILWDVLTKLLAFIRTCCTTWTHRAPSWPLVEARAVTMAGGGEERKVLQVSNNNLNEDNHTILRRTYSHWNSRGWAGVLAACKRKDRTKMLQTFWGVELKYYNCLWHSVYPEMLVVPQQRKKEGVREKKRERACLFFFIKKIPMDAIILFFFFFLNLTLY